MEVTQHGLLPKLTPWPAAPPDGFPHNDTSQALEASRVVASGRRRLYGVGGYNSGAAQFILLFDASALPADGTVARYVLAVGAAANFSIYYGSMGRWFERGIVICNSSTEPTKTIGAADCFFDVQFY